MLFMAILMENRLSKILLIKFILVLSHGIGYIMLQINDF